MNKFYQVINDQYQPVRVFVTLSEARSHIADLQKTYKNESFYVVEMPIVYSAAAPSPT